VKYNFSGSEGSQAALARPSGKGGEGKLYGWELNMPVFWVVAPCSLGDRPDDGGSKDL
jgi:hypothetical protein